MNGTGSVLGRRREVTAMNRTPWPPINRSGEHAPKATRLVPRRCMSGSDRPPRSRRRWPSRREITQRLLQRPLHKHRVRLTQPLGLTLQPSDQPLIQPVRTSNPSHVLQCTAHAIQTVCLESRTDNRDIENPRGRVAALPPPPKGLGKRDQASCRLMGMRTIPTNTGRMRYLLPKLRQNKAFRDGRPRYT